MAGEIYNSQGKYVGYMDASGNVHDKKGTRGTLGGSTQTAGARMAARNPAESIRISAERRAGRL